MLVKNKAVWTPDNSYLLEYRARAEAGEIVIGQELRIELDNLAKDMKDDRYIYDRGDALLRMDFMENCVRLTKSPFYNRPMKLMLWQKALTEALYSFKMAEQSRERGMWIDRFKKLLLLIARKNTKSETSSALALSELITGNEGADIVASSNDDNQASIVYDAIDTMRRLIDPDDLDTKRNQRHILHKASGSKIFKLSDRTRNKEGRNIDFAIIDETHEMKENVIGKSIEQSQSLKDNPKFINISTEGFTVDGYLDEELKKARAVIADWFYSLHADFGIRLWKCGYDQRFSRDWIARMGAYNWERTGGDDGDLILINQNAQTLSNAMKLCEADFRHQLINYNEDPVDRWCLKNAGIKADDRGQCLCVKMEAARRIDGAVALIILYETYRRCRTEFRQMIEKG